jgi:hypothetical protein
MMLLLHQRNRRLDRNNAYEYVVAVVTRGARTVFLTLLPSRKVVKAVPVYAHHDDPVYSKGLCKNVLQKRARETNTRLGVVFATW